MLFLMVYQHMTTMLYYLIRAYNSLHLKTARRHLFMIKEAWRHGSRQAIIDRISISVKSVLDSPRVPLSIYEPTDPNAIRHGKAGIDTPSKTLLLFSTSEMRLPPHMLNAGCLTGIYERRAEVRFRKT